MSGVEVIGLNHSVEMNMWTDANASFIAPGGGPATKKELPDPKKPKVHVDKRLLQIRTNGPFRYDLTKELAHFAKPAMPKPGLVEDVTVSRSGEHPAGSSGLRLSGCAVSTQKSNPREERAEADTRQDRREERQRGRRRRSRGQDDSGMGPVSGDLLGLGQAQCDWTELIHDSDAKMTILKGTEQHPVQAVKEGTLIVGTEMHMFGNGKEITQAHILGNGSIGMGEIDPKTGEYPKQAFWNDRLVFTREGEKDKLLDVFTFIGKDGRRAMFKDTSSGELQQIEAMQLKSLAQTSRQGATRKEAACKKAPPKPKKDGGKDDPSKSARPMRLEGTGEVRATTPDMVIKHAEYLNVCSRTCPS